MNVYRVTFQYEKNGFYHANIAVSDSKENVIKHYSDRVLVNVSNGFDYDLETAERKGMPIVHC